MAILLKYLVVFPLAWIVAMGTLIVQMAALLIFAVVLGLSELVAGILTLLTRLAMKEEI
jgi:hypothetical protein